MRIFRCKVCEGSGEVPNPWFEACRDPATREEYGIIEGDCLHCPLRSVRSECQRGEFISCPNCEGCGLLRLDEEKWEEVTPAEDRREVVG